MIYGTVSCPPLRPGRSLSPQTQNLQKSLREKPNNNNNKKEPENRATWVTLSFDYNSFPFPFNDSWTAALSTNTTVYSYYWALQQRYYIFFPIPSLMYKELPPKQRAMTQTIECGSFDRRPPFAKVLMQHSSVRAQVLMSSCEPISQTRLRLINTRNNVFHLYLNLWSHSL